MTWLLPESERFPCHPENRNRGRGGVAPDVLVWHYAVDGDDTPDGMLGSLNFAPRERSHDCMDVARLFARKSRGASAHFAVGRDGSKVQCAALSDTAWHAGGGAFPRNGVGPLEKPVPGRMNRRSIGIEVCNAGWAVDKLKIPAEHRREACHNATPRKVQTWETYSDEQVETMRYLTALLVQAVPSLRFMTGHDDVVNRDTTGGSKVDPGPLFPWDALEGFGLQRVRYDFKRKAWV